MQRLLARLAWRNLSLRVKVALLFLSQVSLIAIMGTVVLAGQAAIRREVETNLTAAVEMQGLARDLQLNIQMARQVQSRLVEERHGWAVFYLAGPVMSNEHEALISQLLADMGELEALAASTLGKDDRVPFDMEMHTVRASLETGQQSFAAMVDLVSRLTNPTEGALPLLARSGDALEALTVEQANADLLGQAFLMRNLEHNLIETGSSADLTALREAADAYLAIYQTKIPQARRSGEIPAALTRYLAQADQVALLLTELDTTFDASQLALGAGLDAASRLGALTEAHQQARLEAIDARQDRIAVISRLSLGLVLGLGGLLSYFFGHRLAHSAQTLLGVMRRFEAGNLDVRAPVPGEDEFSQLGAGFNALADRLTDLVDNLEKRVAERTRDLSITADIGRAITAQPDPRSLMNEVVELIRQRFGFYHAQVFLLDESREMAVLAASTGTAGHELLARGHALPVGSQSVIGQVTARGEPIVASDTDTSPVHRRNELLPDTRSEMALPMRIGDRVIGALDVQSVAPDVFDEDVVAVFQIMADQLAVALDNARLQAALAEMRAAMAALERRMTAKAWEAYRRSRGSNAPLGYELREAGCVPCDDDMPSPMQSAMISGRLVRGEDGSDGIGLAVPIKVRGEVIGAFGFGGEAIADLTEDELGLVEAVADRVGLALENLRLVEETARRAEREQLVNEITAKIVGSTDVSHILQTTVRELGRMLRAPQTSVRLRQEDTGRS